MTVNIIFASASAGDSLPSTVDLGSEAPGSDTDAVDVYIRHDGTLSITDCEFYIQRYVGLDYLGTDEDSDYTEILSWGEETDKGFYISQDQPTFATKTYFKLGEGDIDAPITLSQNAIIGTPSGDGVIPSADEAHLQFGLNIPSTISSSAGYKAITLVFSYSATS